MRFSIGDMVAWDMLDGHIMVGEVTERTVLGVFIKRVDGCHVGPLTDNRLRLATDSDVNDAIAFYTKR